MTAFRSLIAAAALLLGPALAQAQTPPVLTPQEIKNLAEVRNQAVFCEGRYALCIKAACTPIPTLGRLGNYYVDRALCSCEVEDGVSMGPGQCADRRPVTQDGRTYMISTYSNRFNTMNNTLNNTLTCKDASTTWAWCYGAPCVVDERDPAKANCTCPVLTGPMQTLGGQCDGGNCKYIYSAATIPGDLFANEHFYNTVKQQYPNYPVNMPAKLCLPPKAPG
jgi:hypothetical protein